ncbi:MAG: TonB-dependent receptor [Lewinellaceae bacterium]|nr:TonB-dependent receptor [Lewinellaceae bacterium]
MAQSTPIDSARLQTVVIQGTRADAGSPVPHTNLTAAQLKREYHAQDVPFLLSSVPSLVESSDAGTGIGYTGLRLRGSDPTRINVTINGVPLNDAESQIVYWVDLPDLASSANEIQVQRGVGLSTNGAGAFGGSVNLDLSKVEADPFARISNTIGAFNTRKHSAFVGTGLLANRFAFTGRISSLHSGGYVDRATADLNSFHLSGAYVGKNQSFMAHLLSGHEITYQAWYGLPAQYLEIDSLRRYNEAGMERPGSPYPNQVDDYTQRHYLLHYRLFMPQGLQLQLNGHYTRGFGFYEEYKAQQSLPNYYPQFPAIDTFLPTDLVRRRQLDNHFYGSTFVLRWEPPVNPPMLYGGPSMTLGGGLHRYEGQHCGEVIWANWSPLEKDARYYDNNATKTDGNLYGQINIRWKKGWTTFADVQYRQVSYNFEGVDNLLNNVTQQAVLHFWNPKAGLRWNFRPNWTSHLFYGIGHREPNRDDYTQSTPESRPKPERLRDLEAGISQSEDQWKWSANVYYMQYKDQLVLDGSINDVGAYIRTNIPDSYRAGVELEAQWRPNPRFETSGNLSLSRNKIKTFVEYLDDWDNGTQIQLLHEKSDLAFSPEAVARLALTWHVLPQHPRQQLDLNWTSKYVGQQFLDNTSNTNSVLDAYTFTDLRINYQLKNVLGADLSIIASVNNLLDAKYASNGWTYRYVSNGYDERPFNPYTRLEGNGVYNQSGYFPQAGRNWMLSVVISL